MLNFARAIYSLLDLQFSKCFEAVIFKVSVSESFSRFFYKL